MGLKAHLCDRYKFACLYDPRAFDVGWNSADEKELKDLLERRKKTRHEQMEAPQMRRAQAMQAEAEAEAMAEAEAEAEGYRFGQHTSYSSFDDGTPYQTGFSAGYDRGFDHGFQAGVRMSQGEELSTGSEPGRNVRSRLN